VEVNSQKKHIKNVIKLKIHIEMQESKLIYNHCSSFDEIFYGYPNQSRRDFNLPGYIEFLHEFENPLYLGIQNNPIDNIKIKYLSKNEEGEEAQGEEGEEENDYIFADNNDNSENIIEEKNLQFNSLEPKRENINELIILESLEINREIIENIFKDISDSYIEKGDQILNKGIKNEKIEINKNKNKYIIQKK
jgi:hypothetical protein